MKQTISDVQKQTDSKHLQDYLQLFLLTQFWFHRFRKLDAKNLDHRRRLIDSFVNAIFLYDDRITFTFNYKDGSKTITFAELEKSGLGSDISALAAAKGSGFYPTSGKTPRRRAVFLPYGRLPSVFS